jgi:molybdopterin synthase sulfur carrier subunit
MDGIPQQATLSIALLATALKKRAPFRRRRSITHSIRVALPYHLRNLAHIDGDVTLEVPEPITIRSVLDALEARYPMLCGTIRDHDTLKRRPFLRFFACEEDVSLQSPENPLPEPIATGKEPLLIIGAIAGG